MRNFGKYPINIPIAWQLQSSGLYVPYLDVAFIFYLLCITDHDKHTPVSLSAIARMC